MSLHTTSNANDSLRRTRSTNSIHRRSSSHSLIDPVVAKQHALVAATLAYEKAHGKEANHSEQRQPQIRRKRSARNGRFEGQGSHFKESQPLRHRSSKRLSDIADATSNHSRSRRGTLSSSVSEHEFTPQSVLSRMPSIRTIHEDEHFGHHRSSISVHKLRKAKSMYSPTPQTQPSATVLSAEPPPSYPPPAPPVDHHTHLRTTELDIVKTVDIAESYADVPLTMTNLAAISNLPSQPVYSLKKEPRSQSVRHRASLMLTPFKKRQDKESSSERVETSTPQTGNVFETVVRPPGPVAETTPRFDRHKTDHENKKSGFIKAKIRSVFRRTSGPPQELPAQQVNASRAYFRNTLSFSSDQRHLESPSYADVHSDSSATIQSLQPPALVARGTSPAQSVLSMSTKSRVTSWADSTIAGTVVGLTEDQRLDVIDEEHQTHVENTDTTRTSSLNFLKRMRRASRASMQKMEPPSGDAKRAASRQSIRTKSRSSDQASGALETLPSQLRHMVNVKRTSIRAVSQETNEADDMNNERSNSELATSSPPSGEHVHSGHSTIRRTQGSRQAQSLVISAPPPSADQIASRVRRSEERWQEPLDGDRSLFFPRSPKSISPSRHVKYDSNTEQDMKTDGFEQELDQAITDNATRDSGGFSPSIYSQDDQGQIIDSAPIVGATLMPQSEGQGSAVIGPSRRFVTESPTRQIDQPEPVRHTSQDWQRWLQSEVQDLSTTSTSTLELSTDYIKRNPRSGHHSEATQIEAENVAEEPKSLDLDASITIENTPPCIWQAGQPSAIKQRSSDSSIPSTSTSAQFRSQHFFQRQGSDDGESSSSLMRANDARSSSSRTRKTSYRYGAEDRPSSRLHDIDEQSSFVNRPSSRMNDRFPFIDSSRPQSRVSRRSSTPAPSTHSHSSRPTTTQRMSSSSDKNKENNAPSPLQTLPARPTIPRSIRRPMSSTALNTRSTSSLAHYTNNNNDTTAVAFPPATPQPSLLPRPAQTHSSPRRSTTAVTERVTTRRQPYKHISMPSLEADPTLASIFQGPYSHRTASRTGAESPRPLSIRKATSASTTPRHSSPLKENSTPMTPRLAAQGASGERKLRTPTSGQRLAEQFLSARRFREEMRVMSPGTGSPRSGVDVDVSELSGVGAFL